MQAPDFRCPQKTVILTLILNRKEGFLANKGSYS